MWFLVEFSGLKKKTVEMHVPVMIQMLLLNPSARILVLAAIGLAALVMIHVLAQDFNRIRRPSAGKLLRSIVFKRDTELAQRLAKETKEAVSVF